MPHAPQNMAPPIAPLPEKNEADAMGVVSRRSTEARIYEEHRGALRARRQRDLISEKLRLHYDGSGDLQWADIYFGERVEIPRDVSEFRKTENILRIVVDNAVAYHTTMPLRYYVESTPDRRAKEQATIDMLWANNLAQVQDFNGLFSEALYEAMYSGFCPVHAYWRDDAMQDWYEPVEPGASQPDPEQMAADLIEMGIDPSQMEPAQMEEILMEAGTEQGQEGGLFTGMIDCFVGNPLGTTYNRGATRNSVQWCTYERLLSADRVREHFAHMPGVAGIEGTTRIPTASLFQRVARDWMLAGLGAHGDPTIQYRRGTDDAEELIIVLCREEAPAPENDHMGRLQMVALPGAVDVRKGGEKASSAVLLTDQPLPGGDWSWTNFYSHHRGGDILGKPWMEDLDQIQVDLNIALSKRWEITIKMSEAPIVAPAGAITEDMADIGGYNLMEIEPSLGGWRPRVMEWPQSILEALKNEVAEKRSALYTLGGYQAASRGEAPGSRMSGKAIVTLQIADNSIHGPVNMRFRRAACDFTRRCYSQMKAYGNVPWLMEVAGDENSHLVESYIGSAELSDKAPQFQLVNSFGATPEVHAQELLELVGMRGADGQPVLRTDEFRRQYPRGMIFDDAGNPDAVRRRHAHVVAIAILDTTRDLREQSGFDEEDPTHPWIQQAATMVFQKIETLYPRQRDDDLEAHLSRLSEITQDDSIDPIARRAAAFRQELYYEWQASMAQASAPVEEGAAGAQGGGGGAPARSDMDPRRIAAEAAGGGGGAGTTLQDVGAQG